ncbi:UNVERIFIED_CONTAM: hypothetical protein NY603_35885, partial [Bacteroidetes bacterium 56_B9]
HLGDSESSPPPGDATLSGLNLTAAAWGKWRTAEADLISAASGEGVGSVSISRACVRQMFKLEAWQACPTSAGQFAAVMPM